MLELHVRSRAGDFTLDVGIEAPPGAVTVLVGESGAGKSTLLRLAAGLQVPDAGRIALHGRVLAEPERGTWVPPEERCVGYVTQDYALFPHLSVRDNVAFGPRSASRARDEVRERTARSLARFGLEAVADRRPRQLSGGQQQRVALARALALDPALVLLDEPLSALDPLTRREVRSGLREVLAQFSCVTLFVTHSPTEALAFGDRIAVVEAGRITQHGTPAELARHPGSRYVAEFLGVNLLAGTVVERPGDGSALVRAGDALLRVPDPGVTGAVRLRIHPHDVTLSLAPPTGSARNVLSGPVEELVPEPPAGERLRVLLATRPPIAAQVTRSAADALGLAPGVTVHASFKATATEVLPG